MSITKAKYVKAATSAGFFVDLDDVSDVIETTESFIIIGYDDNEDQWLVCEFRKGKNIGDGDYTGVPLFEGTNDECKVFLKDYIITEIGRTDIETILDMCDGNILE